MIGGRVLDTSTLVDFALVRPYSQALVWTAVEESMVLVVPAAALAAAFAETPPEAHDALVMLLDLPTTVVEPLDRAATHAVGALLTARDADEVRAGQVVLCGLRRGWPVVSAQSWQLRRIHADVDVDELP